MRVWHPPSREGESLHHFRELRASPPLLMEMPLPAMPSLESRTVLLLLLERMRRCWSVRLTRPMPSTASVDHVCSAVLKPCSQETQEKILTLSLRGCVMFLLAC